MLVGNFKDDIGSEWKTELCYSMTTLSGGATGIGSPASLGHMTY